MELGCGGAPSVKSSNTQSTSSDDPIRGSRDYVQDVNSAKGKVMPNDNNNVRVAGVWRKESKNGNEYLKVSLNLGELMKSLGYDAGGLESVWLVGFPTKNKKDKQPDYSLYYSLEEKQ
jgi:hypothetical protein